MNFKITWILFGILITILVVFGLVQNFSTPPNRELYIFPSTVGNKVKNEDIVAIEIRRTKPKEETIALERDPANQEWRLTQPYATRAEAYPVGALLGQVFNATVVNNPELTHSLQKDGLDPPNAVATFRNKEGRTWTVNIGEQSTGDPSEQILYITTSELPKESLAVHATNLDVLLKDAKYFRSKDLLGDNQFKYTAVTLQNGKDEVAFALKDPKVVSGSNSWRFVKPDFGEADYGEPSQDGSIPRILSGVRHVLAVIEGLKADYEPKYDLDLFVAENVTDLAKYGLESDRKDLLRVTVTRRAGGSFGGDPKLAPITDTLLINRSLVPEKHPKMYYARLESEKHVVALHSHAVDMLLPIIKDPTPLREKELVHVGNPKGIDAIDIKNDAGEFRLRQLDIAKQDWKAWDAKNKGSKGAELDSAAVNSLVKALTGRGTIDSFPARDKTDEELGLDKPVAEMSLWFEGTASPKKDEKKEGEKPAEAKEEEPKLLHDEPTVQLSFGKPVDKVMYVKRTTGKETYRFGVLVDTFLTQVTQGKLAYLSKKLPTMEGEAVRLALATSDKKDELVLTAEKAKPDDQPVWKVKHPTELVGLATDSTRMNLILMGFTSLSPKKLVVEAPSEADLDKYGLGKKPLHRASLTTVSKDKDQKEQEHIFLFGNPDEKNENLHAFMPGGQFNYIFLVDKRVADIFEKYPLEKRILSFEAPRVKEVRLQGRDKAKKTWELSAKPKSAGSSEWEVVKGPDGFTLDSGKLAEFVAVLANFDCDDFVTNAGPKKEDDLDKETRSLHIEVQMQEGADPLVLDVGKLHKGEKGYYVARTTSPGLDKAVFKINQDRVEKYVNEGVEAFRKK